MKKAHNQAPNSGKTAYPLSAIVGQEEMKLALLLNAVDPLIGGVLVMGQRGTGKSTVVRGLPDLLPEITVVVGCSYRCDPQDYDGLCADCSRQAAAGEKLKAQKSKVGIVELPLGATEDRVCGTIDIEQALRDGLKRFQPGLLARANRGFLYIDEVNLLEDHLVDLLLDVAATGINKVERENISVEHPTRFVLIGSGNPEEGELRPQLVDRFGLSVDVKTEDDLEQRMMIVERRDAFDRNPADFSRTFAAQQEQLRDGIARARRQLGKVRMNRQLLKQIAQLCSELRVDGHRGELTIARAARAAAALEGRKQVTEADVKKVAVMSLRHRLRRDALEDSPGSERIERQVEKLFERSDSQGRKGKGGTESSSGSSRSSSPADSNGGSTKVTPNGRRGSTTFTALSIPASKHGHTTPKVGTAQKSERSSSRFESTRQNIGKAVLDHERGRYVKSGVRRRASTRVALDATLRALMGFKTEVSRPPSPLSIGSDENRQSQFPASALRFKMFKRKQGRLFIFVIDLSGSMALNRITQAKSVMLALLRQSYIKRDSVAIVGFRGATAELLLPPSRSILRARRVLDSAAVGGGTPLSAGLACSLQLARRTKEKAEKFVLLFTDGHANVALSGSAGADRATRQRTIDAEVALFGTELRKSGVRSIVVDTSARYRSNGDAMKIAETLGAHIESIDQSGGSS